MNIAKGVVHNLIQTKDYLVKKITSANNRIKKINLPRFIRDLWQNIKTKAIAFRSVFKHPTSTENSMKPQGESSSVPNKVEPACNTVADSNKTIKTLVREKYAHLDRSIRQELVWGVNFKEINEAMKRYPDFVFEIAKREEIDTPFREECLEFAIEQGVPGAKEYDLM